MAENNLTSDNNMTDKNDQWIADRVAYIKGLKNPSEQQRFLLVLLEKTGRSPDDDRKLNALLRAEKAAERATKAKADAARIIDAEKKAVRKARDRELYQSAGLLILSGLVDTKTGMPMRDRGELLGALMELATASNADEAKRMTWKRAGDAKLAGNQKTKPQELI